MQISIYLPRALLAALDREADRRLQSRSRVASDILWRALKDKDDWRAGLIHELHESALADRHRG